jgi:hypothetical protein
MAQIIEFPKRQSEMGTQESLVDMARTDTLEKRRLGKLFGMKTVTLQRGKPRPGELWKSVKVGTQGPRIYLVLTTSSHKDGGITVGWVARGELGAGSLKSFMENRTRIGWLGETPF